MRGALVALMADATPPVGTWTDPLNRFRLDGRVAIVTGGSRGIGFAIACTFAAVGARVTIIGRRREWLDPALDQARAAGLALDAYQADVSRSAEADACVRDTLKRHGRLDILINNAGMAWAAPMESMPDDKWQRVLDVNLSGPFYMCRAAAEALQASPHGRLINLASVSGMVGSPPAVLDAVGYSASKGGVIALTRDLAVKWAPYPVTVNALAPGYVRTRLTEPALAERAEAILQTIPVGRLGTVEDIAAAALFLASDAGRYITGHVLAIDGGLTAW